MAKFLVIFLLVTSIHTYSTPIVSIKENKLKFLSHFNPYIYGKRNKKIILLGQKKLLKYLKNNDINFKILYKNENLYKFKKKSIISNENFIKYSEVRDKIEQLVTKYPSTIEKIIIGKSVEGRDIIGIKTITNTFAPKYRIVGGIHGDEAMSYQFVYDFMIELIEHNKYYKNILDNTQIYIIPMLNPDGAVNVTRRNANNIDLNRNLGFFWKAIMFSGSNYFSEPETKALRDFTLKENFSMSFSFHTFGNIINYVWNFSPDKVSDTNEIVNISNIYKNFTDYEVTEGYDWYQTTGDLNDYSYGTAGTLDWTIEIDDSDPNGDIFKNNKNAIIEILKTSKFGIEGIISDTNNKPLNSTIIIDGKSIFYNNDNGYFYKYLLSGYHHIKIISQNYEDYETFFKVDFDKPFLNIKLNKKETKTYFTDKIISIKADLGKYGYKNVALPNNLLFLADNRYFSLPFEGEIFIKIPNIDKEKYLEIITKYNFDTNLIIEGYEDLDSDYLFTQKYEKHSILITKNIKYIKIIQRSSKDIALIDSVLFKDKENNNNTLYYSGSGALCSFNSDYDFTLFALSLIILSVYIFKRRKYIEKR